MGKSIVKTRRAVNAINRIKNAMEEPMPPHSGDTGMGMDNNDPNSPEEATATLKLSETELNDILTVIVEAAKQAGQENDGNTHLRELYNKLVAALKSITEKDQNQQQQQQQQPTQPTPPQYQQPQQRRYAFR